jgi:hypothetical protein
MRLERLKVIARSGRTSKKNLLKKLEDIENMNESRLHKLDNTRSFLVFAEPKEQRLKLRADQPKTLIRKWR